MSDSHAWTFTQAPEIRLKKSKGSFIWTDKNVKLFDMTAGGTHFAILGHANEFISEALKKSIDTYSHFDIKTLELEEVNQLSEIVCNFGHTKDKDYKLYMSGCNGADAIEAAIRLSFQQHWLNGNSSKKWVISRQQSYHGMSADALSISDRENLNWHKTTLSQYRTLIPQHNPSYARYQGQSNEQYLRESVQNLEEKIEEVGAQNIACFVGETILGGLIGDVPPLKGYWAAIKKLCDRNNIHLILDEVYCGTGSSGTYHCCEHDKIQPDFIALGKTLCSGYAPLSAILIKGEIYNNIIKKKGRLDHSTTFQGHVLGTTAAIATQTLIQEDDFINSVYMKGEYIRNELHSRLKDNEIYIETRGRGMRNSLEFSCIDRNQFALELGKKLLSSGFFATSKWHRLSITPPLTSSWKELKHMIEIIEDSFKLTSKNYSPMKISYEWLRSPTPTR